MPMLKNFSSMQKMIALLACIVALDVAMLAMIVHNADLEMTQVRRQADSKQMIVDTNDLLDSLYQAGDAMSKYVFAEPGQEHIDRYQQSLKQIDLALSQLSTRLKQNPDREEAQIFRAIDTDVHAGVNILKELKAVSDQNQGAGDRLLTIRFGLRKQAQMQDLLVRLVKNTSAFIALQQKAGEESEEIREGQRVITYSGILAAMTANIILLWLFMHRFGKHVGGRLEQIVQRIEGMSDLDRPALARVDGISTRQDVLDVIEGDLIDLQNNLASERELLMQNERMFGQVIQHMPTGIIVLDQMGRAVTANAEMQRMMPDNDLRIAHEIVDAARQEQKTDRASSTHKGERQIAVRDRHYAVNAADQGQHLMLVQDVTSQVKLEQLKRAFVAMVSHDLRTPLTAVGGFLELLPTGMYGPASTELVDITRLRERDLDDLIGLVNDLLEIEKLQNLQKSGQADRSHWQDLDLKTLTGTLLTESIDELDLGDRIEFAMDIDQAQMLYVKVATDKYRLQKLCRAILSIFASASTTDQEISLLCFKSATQLHLDLWTVPADQSAKDVLDIIKKCEAFSKLHDSNLGLALPLTAALCQYLDVKLDWATEGDRLQTRLSIALAGS